MATIDHARKLTYRDYLRFPDDRCRHEIVDGEHLVSPAPELYHQRLSKHLLMQLYAKIEETGLGEIYQALTTLHLSRTDIVQPDLMVILSDHKEIITRMKVKGIPDLVIEILSPSSSKTDRGCKKERYERAGVPEYWVVDPDAHAVEQYVLENDTYMLAATETERITFRGLRGVTVDLGKVW
jgi:Uma2 family endonuclease